MKNVITIISPVFNKEQLLLILRDNNNTLRMSNQSFSLNQHSYHHLSSL